MWTVLEIVSCAVLASLAFAGVLIFLFETVGRSPRRPLAEAPPLPQATPATRQADAPVLHSASSNA